jgi:hypothetical protein
MNRLPKSAPHWLLIVLLAVLVTRLGGAHLHLCFDGQELPATLHAGDTAEHSQGHHLGEQHSDKDVDVLGAVLMKKSSGSTDMPVLLAVCLVLLLLPRLLGQWPPAVFYQVFPHQPLRLRPPLRGPPL